MIPPFGTATSTLYRMDPRAGDEEQLLQRDQRDDAIPPLVEIELPKNAVLCLLLQHLSNTMVTGLYDFACFLFLIEIFLDTLVPASLVGLFSTFAGLIFSGWIGALVDRTARLLFVKRIVAVEKALYTCIFGVFLVLFGSFEDIASPAFHGKASWGEVGAVWSALLLIVLTTSCLAVAKTGLNVAFERDWVFTISQGNPKHLTLLNAWMRRIDLCSKLGAPLVVSLFTTTLGYSRTTLVLLAISVTSLVAEILWIDVVYKSFPALVEQRQVETNSGTRQTATEWVASEVKIWRVYSSLRVFWSSISIACIYLTTLSYDGTFIAYIKAARGWDDAFIAAMRGLCVVTGLLGTVAMPRLERYVGLERAGAWSIWFEAACLLPVVLAFFIGAPSYGSRGSFLNSILLFGGIALSRIGLYSFDLCQLKELQIALDSHPMRNRLTALQSSLQNLFDLMKYVLTLWVASPDRFQYSAAVSWGAVLVGGLLYSVYLRQVRGHLFHPEWIRKLL